MKIFLATLLLFASCYVSADVYKWTDNSGVVHFGDQPPATTDKNASPVSTVGRASVNCSVIIVYAFFLPL